MTEWWNSQKNKYVKMTFGWVCENLIPQKFLAIKWKAWNEKWKIKSCVIATVHIIKIKTRTFCSLYNQL